MNTTATFTDRALAAVRKNFSIIPCDVRGKGPYGLNAGRPRWGITSKTNTEEGVRAFAAQIPAECNYGVCSDYDNTILETDNSARLRSLLGRPMPETFCVSARENREYWIFKQTAKTRAVRGIPEVEGLFEWRHNGYCVGPGSIHPTGSEYRTTCDVEPVEMPDWLVDELLALHKSAPSSVRDASKGEVDQGALETLLEALHKRGEPEDMLGIEGLVISSLHPTLKPLAAHLYQGPETSDEVVDIVRRVGEAYGHRQPEEKDVEDVVEWLNQHNCKPCFCKDCHDAVEYNLPAPLFQDGLMLASTAEGLDELRKDRLLKEYKEQLSAPKSEGGLTFVKPRVVEAILTSFSTPWKVKQTAASRVGKSVSLPHRQAEVKRP
jgi:hypothetical protein